MKVLKVNITTGKQEYVEEDIVKPMHDKPDITKRIKAIEKLRELGKNDPDIQLLVDALG